MFDVQKIHVFFRGKDMMIALPAAKTHGDDEEVKATLRTIFFLDDDVDIRANHKYAQLPEGWKCFRVANGVLPRQIRNPVTKGYEPWSKIVVVKDEPKAKPQPKVARPDRQTAAVTSEARSEGDVPEMVALPAYALDRLLAQNQEMLAQMRQMMALYELAIQQAGLELIRRK